MIKKIIGISIIGMSSYVLIKLVKNEIQQVVENVYTNTDLKLNENLDVNDKKCNDTINYVTGELDSIDERLEEVESVINDKVLNLYN